MVWEKRVGIRNVRISLRLGAVYIALCLIPVLLIGTLYHRQYSRAMTGKIGENSGEMLALLSGRHIEQIERLEYAAGKFSLQEEVQQLLGGPALSEMERHTLIQRLNRVVADSTLVSQMVKNVVVADTRGRTLFSMGYDTLPAGTLAALMEGAKGRLPLEYIAALPQLPGGKADMVLVRVVKNAYDMNEALGFLLITLDERAFMRRTYEDIYAPGQGEILLLDPEGTVMSAENEALAIGRPHPDPGLIAAIGEHHGRQEYAFMATVGGERGLVTFDYNSKAGWYTVSLLRGGYLSAEMERAGRLILLCSALMLSAGLCVLSFISASIVQPVRRLVKYCEGMGTGAQMAGISDENRDEIAYLTNSVGGMVARINHFIAQERAQGEERRSLELKMLQAQINPHFLFNTLNSIKWIAAMSRVPVVADGIAALSDLLRATILDKNELVPVREEMRNLRSYATIQSLKYAGQFTLAFDVEENLLECLILKFILQPIVENAIFYGVEKAGHPVEIRVRINAAAAGGLDIAVEDDGAGFDTAVLKQEGALRNKRLTGIGIGNVRQRIHLSCGPGYGLHIESAVGRGTAARLHLPLIRPGQEGEQPCTKC